MTRGLPPLFGAPWERQESSLNPPSRPGVIIFLTDEGRDEMNRLSRVVMYDPMGMIQIAGTEEDAEVLAVLQAIDNETIQQWLNTPVVGPIVRRRVIGLFEARYLASHSLRDI